LLQSRHRHDRALVAVLELVSACEDPAMPIRSESPGGAAALTLAMDFS
jgi:hypothetical protein